MSLFEEVKDVGHALRSLWGALKDIPIYVARKTVSTAKALGARISRFVGEVMGRLRVALKNLSERLSVALRAILASLRWQLVKAVLLFHALKRVILGVAQMSVGAVCTAPGTVLSLVDSFGKWMIAEGSARYHHGESNFKNALPIILHELKVAYKGPFLFGKQYGTGGAFSTDIKEEGTVDGEDT